MIHLSISELASHGCEEALCSGSERVDELCSTYIEIGTVFGMYDTAEKVGRRVAELVFLEDYLTAYEKETRRENGQR